MRTQGPTSAISTWSEAGKNRMSGALSTFVPVLGDLVTLLNQNLVKREASGTFTLLERQTLGMIHRVNLRFLERFLWRACAERDEYTREHRFKISLLAERVVHATSGPRNKNRHAICRLNISARAQAEPRRWSQQRNFHRASPRSFPVVDDPTWLATPCQKCKHRHCSSSAATTTLSSS